MYSTVQIEVYTNHLLFFRNINKQNPLNWLRFEKAINSYLRHRKKIFRNFFFNFAPKAILSPRPSGIDCALVRNEIRTLKSFSKLFSIFALMGLYIDQIRKKAPKRTLTFEFRCGPKRNRFLKAWGLKWLWAQN